VDLLPDHVPDEVAAPEHLVHQHAAVRHLGVVKVYPYRAVGSQQIADEQESVAHHRQPDRVLEGVVVLGERLASVERRVDVDQLDLAEQVVRVLRNARQCVQGVVCVSNHEQVPGAVRAKRSVADDISLAQQAHLGDARVVALHPFVAAGRGAEESTVFADPREGQAAGGRRARHGALTRAACRVRGGPFGT